MGRNGNPDLEIILLFVLGGMICWQVNLFVDRLLRVRRRLRRGPVPPYVVTELTPDVRAASATWLIPRYADEPDAQADEPDMATREFPRPPYTPRHAA